MNDKDTKNAPKFEASMKRLEQIVGKLEHGDLNLDDTLKLFEEGIELSKQCQGQLEEAEGKVEILLKKTNGKMAAENFPATHDEED